MISPAAPYLQGLPVSWDTNRAKHLFSERDIRSKSGAEALFSLSKVRGLIPRSEITDKEARADSLEGYKRFIAGDLVMNKMQAWNGVFGFAGEQEGIVSPDYSVFKAIAKVDPRFFTYLFKTDLYAGVFEQLARGMGTAFLRLNTGDFGAVDVPFPSLAEQERIANFLDDKTARIDALIAEKEALVTRLDELRESQISQSVSLAGRSGWVQTRLKYLVEDIIDTEHKTVPFFDDGEFLVARTTNVKKGKLLLAGAKYTDASGFEEWTRRAVPRPGDVLFTREAPAGEACLVPAGLPLCLGQRTVLIRLRRDIAYPPFVVWSLYGGIAARFISDLSQGSTVAHFNMPDIGNIPLFVGPLDDQVRRTEELERLIGDVDALSSHAEEHITRLREYRSSLISAAVTGQLDISTFKEVA